MQNRSNIVNLTEISINLWLFLLKKYVLLYNPLLSLVFEWNTPLKHKKSKINVHFCRSDHIGAILHDCSRGSILWVLINFFNNVISYILELGCQARKFSQVAQKMCHGSKFSRKWDNRSNRYYCVYYINLWRRWGGVYFCLRYLKFCMSFPIG